MPAGTLPQTARPQTSIMEKRLFIVSNRLPVKISGEGETLTVAKSSGGLVTAMNGFLHKGSYDYKEIYWAGVPGCTPGVWADAAHKLPEGKFKYLPVMLYKDQYRKYYSGFANSVLWPLFHYFPSFAEYDQDHFDNYLQANEHFAETLLRQVRPGDTVWIHDYHLMPLAGMLRAAMPELTIGFFLHIPFPSYEVLRLLPRSWQEALLQGILGADLVGFHTIDYAAHFVQTVQMVLGIDSDRHVLRFNNRLIKVDVFPISIDFAQFSNNYNHRQVLEKRTLLRQKTEGQKIIFSVDRLDYTKGVQNRLKAYDLFLSENPEYVGKVIFMMVVLPSRDHIARYADRKRIIEEMVSQINSKHGNLNWQPVNYRYTFLTFSELLSQYTGCDLALITPLRDGMNLVSKEFVASRADERGVLILSEMAGAARELTEALIINPNDAFEISRKIKEGLEMTEEDQQYRMQQMRNRVSSYDVKVWAEDFLTEMHNMKQRQESYQVEFLDGDAKRNILETYRRSKKRLLLLDYDGTLVSFASEPHLAVPGDELLHMLGELGAVPENDVYLISGRNAEWLDKYFGDLPVNLIAEHGARSKSKDGAWTTEVETHSEWKEQVSQIMNMYVRRCPQSLIEEKEFSLAWHYRNSNKEQGRLRAIELKGELQDCVHQHRLQVLSGHKVIEVRINGIDKGSAVKKVLSDKAYDFVFAVGDDRTDEDMFRMLQKKKNCFSIKVGTQASYARYNLMNPQMVISLLSVMNHLSLSALEQRY